MNSETCNSSNDNPVNDLGLIICKSCSQIIGTLPTNGYKKFYIVCENEQCSSGLQGGNEDEF
ncbi:GapA-binding peptide SR1P [Cohnella silvisoli]|uniref:GapA-binding peptide SR1P n=1 Tax=Cohnella silvisoli TaxID=2873699 RepID=A0ABV1L390_9BACL|nr:GapA-binding peptide SR1P [Cohnella silvisoli]MCD9026111.1 GapA-binding peptide SR1P [Cohnella silvisoli]